MIPHNRPTLGVTERDAALGVIASGWVAQGPEVEAFEAAICKFFGLPDGHAVAVSSGSAALYLALRVLGGRRKRIGIPVYSCSALRNAVGLVGGVPVYLDCAPSSPNLDIALARLCSLDILVAPSLFGLPIEVDSNRNYAVIEDVAQSFGAMADGAAVGLRGDMCICSFYASKLITAGGQGGAIVGRNHAIIDAVRDYRQFDSRFDRKFRFNFQMTDLQAAIGRAQLRRLSEFLELRENIFNIYSAGIDLIKPTKSTHQPARYRAVIRTHQPSVIIQVLAEKEIQAIVPIKPEELLDDPGLYPNAADLATSTVSLPIYPSLTLEDAKRIARIVGETL